QAIPDVEYGIHRLRSQRLRERENVLYIPPQAKPTLQSSDDTLFPPMEKTLRLLAGSVQVILLLGDSGGGKSTFNLQLERTLWRAYKRGGAIPLHISLPAIDNPQQNMIAKQLQQLNFSDIQIQEFKQHRQFIVICDGYDESQLKRNIYTTNQLNQPGQWTAKMISSCRSQYLGSDYRARFQPTGDRYHRPTTELFQEAVIASFSRTQIEHYVEQFVQKTPLQAAIPTLPSWTVKEYTDKLNKIPKVIELVSNPFLLTLALRALPRVVLCKEKLSDIRLTRVGLYDHFIEEWLETNKMRLEASTLSIEAQGTLDEILDANFIQVSINYQKDLAAGIYRSKKEAQSFSIPLTRSGSQYQFLHRSILEYLYSRVMSDPAEASHISIHMEYGPTESVESILDHPLNQWSIVSEPSILQFLAERAKLEPLFKSRLLAAVEESKVDARVSRAAANAISILVRSGVWFNGADLCEIRIPGADIQGGQFDSADMEGADLSNVDMSKAWLRQANLSGTQMGGVQFGELPYLTVGARVGKYVFSSDGAVLAVSTVDSEISVYNTTTWTTIAEYTGGFAIDISPTTRELAKEGHDYDVEVGYILTGETRLVLKGHSKRIIHIAYSPSGSLIASASNDTTVRVCSTESGNSLHVLRDHTGYHG
ncbi:WD_REPEATS_REGION domain-containing protein, partial [Mortierella sp. AD032]